MRAAAIVALLLPLCVQAQTVGLHARTWHANTTYTDYGKRYAYREHTIGLYYLHKSVGLGVYGNSIGRTSTWVGWVLQRGDERWDVALTVGAVTGYGGVRPLLVPSARIGPVRASAIPKSREGGSAALHLSIEGRL